MLSVNHDGDKKCCPFFKLSYIRDWFLFSKKLRIEYAYSIECAFSQIAFNIRNIQICLLLVINPFTAVLM